MLHDLALTRHIVFVFTIIASPLHHQPEDDTTQRNRTSFQQSSCTALFKSSIAVSAVLPLIRLALNEALKWANRHPRRTHKTWSARIGRIQ
jgi:hypothetical protein